MLALDKSVDINRLLILLICDRVYENKSKFNLLLTCKLAHNLRDRIFFNQNIKLKKSQFKLSKYKNITSLTIICHYLKKNIIIKYLPPKLKKLKLDVSCKFDNNLILPNNLEELNCFLVETPIVKNFLPHSLRKLIIYADSVNSDMLPPNLIYLKIMGNIPIDFFYGTFPSSLRCLILNNYLYKNRYESNTKIMARLPDQIKHFALNYAFDDLKIEQINNIIPKNITHLEINIKECCAILKNYPLLKKLTIHQGQFFNSRQVSNIPSNIISIYLDYDDDDRDNFIELLSYIKPTVTTLSFNKYHNFIKKYIPSTVKKLKLQYVDTKKILPNTIEELHINKITYTANQLLCIPLNIKKLTIKYDQQFLLKLNIHPDCKIIFKY